MWLLPSPARRACPLPGQGEGARAQNRYRLRWREAVRDPSTSFALLTSLRVTVSTDWAGKSAITLTTTSNSGHSYYCVTNSGTHISGYCPHPRAPGALALSLDRERDPGREKEGTGGSQQPARGRRALFSISLVRV